MTRSREWRECAGCEFMFENTYYVVPPPNAPEGEPFWLCPACWKRMMDAAAIDAGITS